jgi:glycosyltransferase involved in cell wall biosynthesis
MTHSSKGTLLCVSNYRANRGFAWDFIESLYARIADHLAKESISTLVAYPLIPSTPRSLEGSAARAIALDCSLDTAASVHAITKLIQQENVRVVYFTDRPARSWNYARLRLAGVRRIIVHDHSSGERTRPRGVKRAAKWFLARVPGMVADVVVTVSDYVARRQVDVGLIPPDRVVTVWNGLSVPSSKVAGEAVACVSFGIPAGRPVVVCACRATPEKGVTHFLRAFDQAARHQNGNRPVALYLGEGPQMAELQALRESLSSKNDVVLAGYLPDASRILDCADLCVIPSVWQDAFPLAVLEAMARGKPVIASRVGGIPEMIEHGVHGLLVPPADEASLSAAIREVLADRDLAARLGEAARRRVAEQFTPERQISRLVEIVRTGFAGT